MLDDGGIERGTKGVEMTQFSDIERTDKVLYKDLADGAQFKHTNGIYHYRRIGPKSYCLAAHYPWSNREVFYIGFPDTIVERV